MFLHSEESGSVTIEAALVLPIFIFIFLSIYGLFGMLSARQQISRAAMQAGRSLSLDPYLEDKLGGGGGPIPEISDLLTNIFRKAIADVDLTEGLEGDAKAKDRFIRYFANGDEGVAEKKLVNLGVDGGMEGLEITYAEDGDNGVLTVKYKLKYIFDFVKAGDIGDVTHTVTNRLWK